jgi:hypothetical protein
MKLMNLAAALLFTAARATAEDQTCRSVGIRTCDQCGDFIEKHIKAPYHAKCNGNGNGQGLVGGCFALTDNQEVTLFRCKNTGPSEGEGTLRGVVG